MTKRQVGLEDSPDHATMSVWLDNYAEAGEYRRCPKREPSSQTESDS